MGCVLQPSNSIWRSSFGGNTHFLLNHCRSESNKFQAVVLFLKAGYIIGEKVGKSQ